MERSGASTSSAAVKLCEIMATSEAQRKASETSPDRSGDLHLAAVARFAAIQEFLLRVGEGYALPRVLRPQVTEAIKLAGDALSTREAKRAQLEAAGGQPLTVCFGRDKHRRIPEMVDGEIAWGFFGDGCGVVFADSVTDSRPVFARYCYVCREKSESRRRSEIVARTAAAAWDGRVAVAGGWRLNCRGCGERFFSDTPQRYRCDNCQH
jgi:hypothetical protein